MRNIFTIPVSIGICFLVGLTASYFQQEALMMWYPLLNKSSLTPPNMVFPIAWSILYICMGVSVGLVASSSHNRRHGVLLLFALQLFLNFMWSILFFYLRNPLWGLVDILLLDIFTIVYAMRSYVINRFSAYLFIPYIAWLLFASYLNGYVYTMNQAVF